VASSSGAPLALYNGARTIEAWVKPNDANFRYVGGWGAATDDQSFSLFTTGTTFGAVGNNNDATFTSPRPLNDGAWHHIVVTYDGNGTDAGYLDGQPAGTVVLNRPLDTTSSSFTLGAYPNGGSAYYGGIDELATYAKALTSAQVAAHFAASGYAVPSAPATVTAVAGGANQVTVSWTAATSVNAPITRYVAQVVNGTSTTLSEAASASSTTLVLSGLAGGTKVKIAVFASNAYGNGPPRLSANVTPTGAASTYATAVLAGNPAAYYRLGEGSGTAAADSSGNGAIGVYGSAATLGAPGAVGGDPDTAINGNGGCCMVTATPALPLYNQPRSLEAWVRPNDGNFRYVASWGTSTTAESFALFENGTTMGVVGNSDDITFPLGRSIVDGAWHHLVVTFDGTTLNAYLDGLSVGSQTFATPLDTLGSNLVIGAYVNGGSPSYGGIDEVAAYPSVLSASDVAAHFAAAGDSRPSAPGSVTATAGANQATVSWSAATATGSAVSSYEVIAVQGGSPTLAKAVNGTTTNLVLSGLAGGKSYSFRVLARNAYGAGPSATSSKVSPTGPASTYATKVVADGASAYYRLGDGVGSPVAADSSGSGADGRYSNGATLGVGGAVSTDPDTAASWPAACCSLATAPAALPLNNEPRSFSAWFKTTDANFRYVGGWGSSGTDRDFSIGVSSTQIGVIGYSDDHYFSVSGLNNGVFHQVVATYDGTTITVYVDGASVGTATFTGLLNTVTTAGLVIGADFQGSAPWNGTLDEVAVYPTALSAATVLGQFHASGH
jgi:hypothetical protein